ncbi:unnamed protein product [Cercopithifilaria johnstoni]|uniref:RING-type domain-containing protein n=1 Tax=Cercopithifilaria johnstoni TaxID=2874296 RepID=A0A8J2LXN8_9BILA|nr:unnamed protein product [Cercopithifilaria johnstoni]
MYCPICLDYDDGIVAFAALLCGHVFHRTCISSWLLTGRETKICPVCRKYASGYLNLYFFTKTMQTNSSPIGKEPVQKKSPPKRNKRKFSTRKRPTHQYQLRSTSTATQTNNRYWLRVRRHESLSHSCF